MGCVLTKGAERGSGSGEIVQTEYLDWERRENLVRA